MAGAGVPQTTSPEETTQAVMPMSVGESQWVLRAFDLLNERLDKDFANLDKRIDGLGKRIDDLDNRVKSVEKLCNQIRGGLIVVGALLGLIVVLFRVLNISVSVGG